MVSHEKFEQLVEQLDQDLQEARLTARALDKDLGRIQKAVAALADHFAPTITASLKARFPYIGLADGCKLSDEEFRNLNEDEFDIVLDLTAGTLKYRRDPRRRSELELSQLRGVGPYRTRILAFMIEHPSFPLCSDNVDDRLGDTERIATPQAFIKNISILRQALGGQGRDNPYIRSLPAWESSTGKHARVYHLNPEWQYLLIRSKKSNKSSIDH